MIKPKILIIEDDPSEIFLLRRELNAQSAEFELEVAMDGEEALDFVCGQRKNRRHLRPCLILLDLHLPKHDGIEVLRAIREESMLNQTRIVVTTSAASPSEQHELRNMGFECRPKPTNQSQFSQLVTDLIAICKGQLGALKEP